MLTVTTPSGLIWDVGDAVPLQVEVRDAAGDLTDATMAVAVVSPDGTVVDPAPTVTHVSTGLYTATVAATSGGTWRYTWTASGALVEVEPSQFEVSTRAVYVASMADLKAQLNRRRVADIGDDAELRGYLAAATEYVEWRTRTPITPRQYTERHYVGTSGLIAPRHGPLTEVASITPDDGTALAEADYIVDTGLGAITLRTAAAGYYTVVYTAGVTAIPAAWRLAGLIIAQHLWGTQRGGGGLPRANEEIFTTSGGLAFAVPHRADELLRGSTLPGIA